jgi:hypothetical protein
MAQGGHYKALGAFDRSFSESHGKRAGLRLAKGVRAARLSLTATFFETVGGLSGMIF